MRPLLIPCAILALLGLLGAQTPLRLGTWNVEGLAAVGAGGWQQELDVLARLGADIVGVEEVTQSGTGPFVTWATLAGYPYHALGTTSGTLSGGLRNGIVSVHPIVGFTSHSAAAISGDPGANDITRDIFEARVQVPGFSQPLGVFVVHLKAGSGATNDFRRMVEILRLTSVIDDFRAAHPGAPAVVVGDLNEDLDDGPFGGVYGSLPSGLPSSYSLGSDIQLPITYLPFQAIQAAGLDLSDATQEDTTNTYTTRPSSGRRLDYLFFDVSFTLQGDEVYSSARDNGFDDPPVGNWLAKFGSPLASATSLSASDHLPVFADFVVGAPPSGAGPKILGDLVVSEYLPNPVATSDALGEWIEIRNTTAHQLDVGGVIVRDFGSDTFVLPSLTIAPRGFLLLAVNGSPSQNGGITPDFVWPLGSFTLSNSFDEIELAAPSGLILDSVLYDNGATFPDPNGASVERIDASALPRAANFGVATTPFGLGDLGTPGFPNSIDQTPPFVRLVASTPSTLPLGMTTGLTLNGGPALAGKGYFLGASLCSAPGIELPASGRVVDLCYDFTLSYSLLAGNGVFLDFAGTLDGAGQAAAAVALPVVLAWSGADVLFSGIVVDVTAPDGVISVVDNLSLRIP